MSYRIQIDEPVVEGVRRIAREQIERAIDDSRRDDAHDAVHGFRKRCKKLRALVRLVRPALGERYEDENRRFRDAARTLSDLRDAASRVETCDALRERFGDTVDPRPIGAVRDALVVRRDDLARSREVRSRLRRARDAMRTARDRVRAWKLTDDRFDAVAGGLRKTYGRARRARSTAYASPGVEAFHDWRKRVKYHRYHVRLLRDVWRPIADPWREQLHALTDLLGDDHDLAVLVAGLERSSDLGTETDRTALTALALRRSGELRALARPLGDRLFAEPKGHLAGRVRAYWCAARADAEAIRATFDAGDCRPAASPGALRR